MLFKDIALDTIIDHLPMLVISVDENMVVRYNNLHIEENDENIERGPGYYINCINCFSSQNECGKTEKCKSCKLRNIIMKSIKTLTPSDNIEVEHIVTKNNVPQKVWFRIQTIPIKSFGKNQILVSISDITEYKERNEELIRLSKEAEAANKAKSEFLANMSHEIRTPLNGIIGMTDLTLESNLTLEQRENLSIVKNCAHTLLSLINNILDLSKIEAEKVTIEHIDFDIEELIKNVALTNLPKANEKYIEIHYKIDDKVPKKLIGDSHRISQVLNNLLSNAVKFTEKGFVMVQVKEIGRTNNFCEVEFSVEDVGIGISEDEMQFLFKSFSQVDGSITRKYGGTGLGLSISQKIVNLMGGEIKVASQKGVGSRFYFNVNLEEAQKDIENLQIETVSKENFKEETILLVEDNPVNKLVVRKMLKEIGYIKVKAASNGIEALKLIEKQKFDIILMDIEMPELDGIETVKIIRENEKKIGGRIPIVAITAYALKGDKEKFLSQGMDDYISKPVDIKELIGVLNKIYNDLHSDENNIIKEYLKTKNDDSIEISIDIERKLLDKLVMLDSYIVEDSTGDSDYIEIERIAHEIKIESEEKKLNQIKTLAFKIELAARKKDTAKVKDNLNKILVILKEINKSD